jgi:GNAT superfamily N-acetyltransferase
MVLLKNPNPISIDLWKNGISDINARVVEFGGAFVDPQHLRKGIYSELLTHRISVIQQLGAVAVSATWAQNKHVQKKFISHGGIEVARQKIPAGDLCLFVFKLR